MLQRHRFAAVLGAVLLHGGGVVSPTYAAEPFNDVFNGRISFTSFRVDYDPGPRVLANGDIFTMTPNGEDLRQLTDDPADDAQSDWSPDGETIAYRIRKPQSRVNFEIARMPAGGGARTVLTFTPTGSASSMPSWYPDSSAIIFRRSGGGVDADIWTMSPTGEDPHRLFEIGGDQWYPSLNRGMTRLVFATTLSAAGDTDRGLFTSDPDGTDVRLLYDAPGVYDSAPAWAPDGRSVAFESDSDPLGLNPEGDREIFVIAADGNSIRQLTLNSVHDEGPAYSPDGRFIVYSGGPDNLHGDIKVMSSDGEFVRQLTTFDGRDEAPDWQPIPAPATTRSCADLVRRAVRDVRSSGLRCTATRRIVRRWANGALSSKRWKVDVKDFGGTQRVVLTVRIDPTLLVTFLSEPGSTGR